jgi:tetratricopeptide (TPR) repeat protein
MLKAKRKFSGRMSPIGSKFSPGRVSAALISVVLTLFFLIDILEASASSSISVQKLRYTLVVKNQQKINLKIRESLNLQKDFGNPNSALQTINSLFGNIDRRIRQKSHYDKKEAVKALKTIGKILKEEGNFEYKRNYLLIEGLKKKKNGKRFIDCDDYSSLYMLACEQVGLPVELVYTPRHVFLSCRLDDGTQFFWEPVLAEEKDITYYKQWLNLSECSSYPKIINEMDFEALQYCNLGSAWLEKGKLEKALAYYKRAIQINPRYAPAFNNLGVVYAKKGLYDKALMNYKKAQSLDPEYTAVHMNLGIAFVKLCEYEEAKKYFDKVLEMDPKNKKAGHYKAVALRRAGKKDEAFNLLKELAQRSITSSEK